MAKPDFILAHELLGREVLNLQAGEVAGSVVDFGINRDGKVQLIGVLPSDWYSGGRGIAPGAITFLTDDRLCILNGEALQDFSPDGENLISTDSGGQIYGKTVLLHDGQMLGELVDFRFTLTDGKITDLLVLDGEQRRTRVPVEKISTIGKDYIIIERASADGETAAAASEPAGELAPFSGAAAAADAPAAAENPAELEPVAAQDTGNDNGSQAGRGRGKSRSRQTQLENEEHASPAPAAVELSEDAARGIAAEPSAEQEEAADETPVNGSNLDTVFKPTDGTGGGLLEGFEAATEAAAAPVRAEESEDPFATRGITLSKFDQKKLDFLRGKTAHRDIKDGDGVIMVADGENLDLSALARIVEAGLLGEVFIEMTLRK